MRRIILLLFAILPLFAVAQNVPKRVAILETVDKYDKVDYGVEFQLRAFITDAVNKTPGYEGYDRVDMSQISKEQNFQRTGMVSDADIKKLGEMTGAESIVVAEAAAYGDGRIIIAAKIINIESGRIENSTKPKVASTSDNGMETACNELVAELLGRSNASSSPSGVAENNKPQTSGPKRIQINYQDYEVLPGDLEGKYTWSNAKLTCANLTAFGKSDWYLPNKEELNALYKRKDEIGGFTGDWYWSSSEYDSGHAWVQSFSGGDQGNSSKHNIRRVRCVRKN